MREQPLAAARRPPGSSRADGLVERAQDVAAGDDADDRLRPRRRRRARRPPATTSRSARRAASARRTSRRSRVMTLLTGACERPWPIALSRSSRVTTPARCSASPTSIAALPVALADDHRVRDRVVRLDEARRPGHDLAGRERARARPREARRRTSSRASASVPRKIADAACVCPPPPSAAATRARVELGDARAGDAEHALVHLDERRRAPRASVRSTILCDEVRDPVDVRRATRPR